MKDLIQNQILLKAIEVIWEKCEENFDVNLGGKRQVQKGVNGTWENKATAFHLEETSRTAHLENLSRFLLSFQL